MIFKQPKFLQFMQKTANGCCGRGASKISPANGTNNHFLQWFSRCTKVLFILLLLVQSAAAQSNKTISLNVKNASLKSVMDQVNKQTGVFIVAPRKIYDDTKPVTVNLSNVKLKIFLDRVLVNQPVAYRIDDNTVFLSTKPIVEDKDSKKEEKDTLVNVFGRVTIDGEAIPGATVRVKNQPIGTVTNETGLYTLRDIPEKSVVIISSLGFVSKEITVSKSSLFNIELERTANSLDESVVIGYGTTTKRFATGSVVSVKAEEIEKQPVQNPLLALQGRVPGMVISQSSGYEHGPVKIEIRGRNTLNPFFTSDPLVIIDGVPLTVLDLNAFRSPFSASEGFDQSNMSPAGGQNPLYGINPSDIESIEVLKDADATAIYGSRGANGVILITTKKGKPGKTKVDIAYSQGVKVVTRRWDMLNTQDYIAMRKEAIENSGATPGLVNSSNNTTVNAADFLVWDTTRYTDWQDYIWGNTGTWSNAQVALSGGTELSTFRISGSYNRSSDITVKSGANQNASVSFNFNNFSKDKRFRINLIGSYVYTYVNTINVGSGVSASALPPNAPAILDSTGKPNYAGWDVGVSYPFSGLFRKYENKQNALKASLQMQYNITKNLSAKINFGYNNTLNSPTQLNPAYSKNPFFAEVQDATATFSDSKNSNWIIEPQLNYVNNNIAGKGTLTVLLGGTLQTNNTSSMRVTGTGFADDALIGSISNANEVKTFDNAAQYKYTGAFTRIGMNWLSRYIINLTGRRDGSSRFGPSNRFGNFWGVGGAWILSEEPWLKERLPDVISFIKLRGSYGITGSDGVGDYQFLAQWGNLAPSLYPYNGVVPLSSQLQANSEYHWEVNRKTEQALDLNFFDDALQVSISHYENRSNNQLVSFPTPDYTGFSSVVANSPADVRNTGWEGYINAQIINRKDFSWSANFNISKNYNKLLAYPDLEKSPYYSRYVIGQPLNLAFTFHYLGVNPETGFYEYEDHDKDGEVKTVLGVKPGTEGDDRYVPISLVPDFTGGFGNQFSYKNFRLSVFMEFQKKVAASGLESQPGKLQNISRWTYENRWREPGQKALAPKLSAINDISYTQFAQSDGNYADASYIRVKTVAFSYALPKKLAERIKMSSMRINFNAQNLFTITNYKGMDPDVTSFGSMPPVRTITAGIACSF